MKILFVCTGNICRTPLAEALLRHEAARKGLSAGALEIESAGTQGYHQGDPPDPRSIKVARDMGVSMDGQRARKIVAGDFERFDLILAMDRGHLAALRQMAPPGAGAQIELFMRYGAGRDEDVPDPYYGEMNDFVLMRDMVSGAIVSIIEKLKNQNDFR